MEIYVDKIACMEDEVVLMAAFNRGRAMRGHEVPWVDRADAFLKGAGPGCIHVEASARGRPRYTDRNWGAGPQGKGPRVWLCWPFHSTSWLINSH